MEDSRKAEKAVTKLKNVLEAKNFLDERLHKKYRVKKLSLKMIKMLRALVIEGKTAEEIAENFGYNAQHISNIKSSEAGQAYISQLIDKIDKLYLKNRVSTLANRSIKVLEDILMSNNPDLATLRATVARDILDRLGVQETKEDKVTHEHFYQSIRDTIEDISKKKEVERDNTTGIVGTA